MARRYAWLMLPADTSSAASLAQRSVYRRLEPSKRVEMAVAMCEDARSIAMAGIAARHPEYSAAQVADALHRLLLGDESFLRAWPDRKLLAA